MTDQGMYHHGEGYDHTSPGVWPSAATRGSAGGYMKHNPPRHPEPYYRSMPGGDFTPSDPGMAKDHASRKHDPTMRAASFDSSGSLPPVPQVVVSSSMPHHPSMQQYPEYSPFYPPGAPMHRHPPPLPPTPYPYYHHYPPHGWASSYHHPPPYVAVEYITDLGPEDVLSGRGGATNSYRGNRSFRALVKEFQEKYLQAKKRDKPAVASIVVDLVRKKGGRFLRRCDEKTGSNGQVYWIDIGDDRAREKTCQALREGAPEIRRKYNTGSVGSIGSNNNNYDNDATNHHIKQESLSPPHAHGKHDTSGATLASPSTVDEALSSSVNNVHPMTTSGRGRVDYKVPATNTATTSASSGGGGGGGGGGVYDGPIRIRPWARLIPNRPPVRPIDLEQLSASDRDTYLRFFLPPEPSFRNYPQTVSSTITATASNGGGVAIDKSSEHHHAAAMQPPPDASSRQAPTTKTTSSATANTWPLVSAT